MSPLETYLQELRGIRSSGAAVRETSYYPPLANLLNEIGKKLKPKVRCIIHLQDTGAGLPDGGIFTEDQIRGAAADLAAGAVPARGAIEAKPTSADAWKIAESKQVKHYWDRYRQVLVTNYRDFVLVGQTPSETAWCWKRTALPVTSTTSGARRHTHGPLPSSMQRASRSSSSA